MKKGFTLIEIQAVVLLLGIIVLISMPSVLGRLKAGDTQVRKMIEDTIFDASRSYIINNPDRYRLIPDNVYCITIDTLITEGYFSETILDNNIGSDYDRTDIVSVYIETPSSFYYEFDNYCEE